MFLQSTLLLAVTLSLPSAGDPIPEILSSISAERLKADVETLAGFGTRHSFSDTTSAERGVGAARRWLRDELKAISSATGDRLQVEEQRFSVEVRGQEVQMVNVFGFLPGRSGDPLGRTYVVSGHYDSRTAGGMDATSDAPGANDDASGVAVVLELARVMTPCLLEANVVFLCVDGEELGLFGAKHFVKWADERGLQLDGMITDDMVGGIEGGNGVVDEMTVRCFSRAENGLHSPSRELARGLADSASRYVDDFRIRLVYRLDRFGRGGDHAPFDAAGIPALRLTEANEHFDRQHTKVREEDGVRYGDLPEFVSGDYMARVARVNAAFLTELALAPPPPEAPRMRAANRYDTQLTWAPVEGAAGYEVVWRATSAARWEHVQRVGPETTTQRSRRGEREAVSAVVPRVTADNCFFGVRSIDVDGHRSRAVTPGRP